MPTPAKIETPTRTAPRSGRRGRLAAGLCVAALLGGLLSGVTPANAQGARGTTNPAEIVVGPPD